MTRDELLALPLTVDLETAGRAIGCGRTKAYELAQSGKFPVPVLHLGHRYRVVTAELHRLLGIGTPLLALLPSSADLLWLRTRRGGLLCCDHVVTGDALTRGDDGRF